MAKLSMSRAWDEAREVLLREGRLLGPLALALFVFPGILLSLAVPDAPPGELPPAGPWIAAFGIAIVISLAGQLAVLRLALGPSTSVGQAITHGARRLPPYLAAGLLWIAPFAIAGYFLRQAIGTDPAKPAPGPTLGLFALCVIVLFLSVRLILGSPVASAENVGPIEILKRSWESTRGNWWRLFAFLLLFGIGALALSVALRSVLGLLAQLATGDVSRLSAGGLLVEIAVQLLSAAISTAFFVMLARIYVQLSGRSSVAKRGT